MRERELFRSIQFVVPIWLALVALTSPVSAEFVTTLRAEDREPFDRFGLAVAISGQSALVGGDQDDMMGGEESGAVYLFDVATGEQRATFTANESMPFDQFGSAVAIKNNTALVGAVLDDTGGRNAGAAYLFDATTGQQLHQLKAQDASAFDRLAWSVAITDNVAIATTRTDGDSDAFSGAAYLFDVASGQQLQKLTTTNVPQDLEDFFGWSVAANNEKVIVGAIGDDHAGTNSGAAYVFDIATGQQLAKLTADDATSFDRFGTAVAISGNTAIVTARTESDGGDFDGKAYLFDLTTGNQIGTLVPDEDISLERFGWSIDTDGKFAIIGAVLGLSERGVRSGAAYLFDLETGEQVARLTGGNVVGIGDNFGFSVGLDGVMAIVGAPNVRDETGAAILFNLESTTPEPTTGCLIAMFCVAMAIKRRK